MNVFAVGDDGPEHNWICSIHKTYEGALKAWNEHRLELLREAEESLDYAKSKEKIWIDMYASSVKKLSCEDPEKIDNYPHKTPYLRAYEVRE